MISLVPSNIRVLHVAIVPVGGPGHGVVEENHRGSDVEDLGAESSPRVEDGSVAGAGEWVLFVGAEGVHDDALLRLAT